MINLSHDCYNRRLLFHLKFVAGIKIGSVDNTDDLELLFWNYIISGIYHLLS